MTDLEPSDYSMQHNIESMQLQDSFRDSMQRHMYTNISIMPPSPRVGAAVGLSVGTSVGSLVGTREGSAVGTSVGSSVGSVGTGVGRSVGTHTEEPDGMAEKVQKAHGNAAFRLHHSYPCSAPSQSFRWPRRSAARER